MAAPPKDFSGGSAFLFALTLHDEMG